MQILPCTREHIPGVVALLAEGGAADPDALARYLEDVYLDNPWYDPELPSLVCADGGGRVDGFLGVVARPMALRGGQAIRAAASSNFRVRGGPGAPRNPLIAMRLLKRFFEGAQDLSVANGANPLSKKIWEGCGRGLGAALQSRLVPADTSGARPAGTGCRIEKQALAARPAPAHRRRGSHGGQPACAAGDHR